MAARIRALAINDEWRSRIQTSMLINRLQDHVLNKITLKPTQLKAIEILLRKVAPDLSQVDGNLNVVTQPEARAYPLGLPVEQDRLSPPQEAMDSVH